MRRSLLCSTAGLEARPANIDRGENLKHKSEAVGGGVDGEEHRSHETLKLSISRTRHIEHGLIEEHMRNNYEERAIKRHHNVSKEKIQRQRETDKGPSSIHGVTGKSASVINLPYFA